MTKNYHFSQFRSQEFDALCELLCSIFNTSSAELTGFYQALSRDLEKPDYPKPFADRSFFQSLAKDFQDVYQSSPVVSVDLPSIWEWDDSNTDKPTVVLIGQDPKMNYRFTDLVIGTPYGLHHKDSREGKQKPSHYWVMIQDIMNLGYRVYLTDIWKLWVCDPASPFKSKSLNKVDRDRFVSILKQEITLQKPDAVITWGRPAQQSISCLKLPYLHLNIPHPSPMPNSAWKALIGKQSFENKLSYWRQFLKDNLEAK